MKKVLHVLPRNKLSGAEKMALLICKNLKQNEAKVVCGGEELAAIFRKNNIKAYVLNFSNKKIVNTLFGLKKIIKENEIQIIHAHDNTASLNSYLTKKIFNLDVKVISHIHSCYPWLNDNGINKKIDSFFRPKYDVNIACGKLVHDFYEKNTNYYNNVKFETLSNAIDISEVEEAVKIDKKLINKKFNIPSNKKIIGFIGRFEEMKGLVPFIKELENYKHKFDDCKFLLVGSGSLENEIKTLIKESNLEDLFILTGFQKDVYKFYPIIDILFLPSLYEGLPMVILEAMAFQIPVISMNVGSIDEVIINEKTGFLITNNDLKNFGMKLIELKDDNNLIKKIGKNAFDRIKKNYNMEVYINKVEYIYIELQSGESKKRKICI